MIRLFLALSLVACFVLAPTSGHAAESPVLAPAPFAVPPAGTRLTFEDLETGNRRLGIVKKPNGLVVRWSWQGEINESLTHFCPDCLQAGLSATGGPLKRIYPLEKGKGISFSITRGNKAWQNEILVVGTEAVVTPAGSFDCFVVRRRVSSADSDWRGEQRLWYAPSLGWVVKFESFDTTGRTRRWELVALD